jgi:lincosamide nucleotidyltransferase B/F
MLSQVQFINKLHDLCQQDQRIVAAMLYGSFAMGEGDAYSDVECVLFIDKDALTTFDKQGWVEQLAPTLAFFADDFGHYTAIFDTLLRGEFHFDPAESIATVSTWKGNAWFPSAEQAILIDRTGALRKAMQPLIGAPPERDNAATVERFIFNFANLVLFGINTLGRGELARSLDLLSLLHRYLLWMARLVERSTAHWPTPSRKLEAELSTLSYQRFAECTARLDRADLERAYRATAKWGGYLSWQLGTRHNLHLPHELLMRINEITSYFNDSDSAR